MKMEIITWTKKYSANNFLLDAQHKKLISIIIKLHSAMKDGKAKNIMEIILDDLIMYTKEHFRTEERMMLNANYTSLKKLIIEHEKLTERVVAFQNRFWENTVLISMYLLNF
jgi:hemerythrin